MRAARVRAARSRSPCRRAGGAGAPSRGSARRRGCSSPRRRRRAPTGRRPRATPSRSREPRYATSGLGVGGLRRPADGALPSSAPAPAAGGGGARARPCLRPPPPSRRRSTGRRAGPASRSRSASTCFGFERPPSGCRRGDHAQPHLRVVERLRRALERGGEAGRRRRRHRDAVGRLLRERSARARSSRRRAGA